MNTDEHLVTPIKIGNTNLTPNTAIIIPQRRNLLLQTRAIVAKIVAFTTALSKDKLSSKTDKMVPW